ncbi:c-type cytochrome [Undibacterium sp. Ren11W]|uniref:c-type cytochrome n=1 Tax=Undibacterium sp. Ren11W TaxID=3413045 RepID=UPI003BF0EB9C
MFFKHSNNVLALSLVLAFSNASVASEDGRAVYIAVCSACHAPENVLVSAPKAGDTAEWRKRLLKGIDAAADNAIKGVGAMPPKGGHTELSRGEILRAIEFMQTPNK